MTETAPLHASEFPAPSAGPTEAQALGTADGRGPDGAGDSTRTTTAPTPAL